MQTFLANLFGKKFFEKEVSNNLDPKIKRTNSNFKNERQSILENFRIVNPDLLSMNEDALTHLLLHGNNTLTDNTNTFLLNSVTENIISTKRLNDPLIL